MPCLDQRHRALQDRERDVHRHVVEFVAEIVDRFDRRVDAVAQMLERIVPLGVQLDELDLGALEHGPRRGGVRLRFGKRDHTFEKELLRLGLHGVETVTNAMEQRVHVHVQTSCDVRRKNATENISHGRQLVNHLNRTLIILDPSHSSASQAELRDRTEVDHEFHHHANGFHRESRATEAVKKSSVPDAACTVRDSLP